MEYEVLLGDFKFQEKVKIAHTVQSFLCFLFLVVVFLLLLFLLVFFSSLLKEGIYSTLTELTTRNSEK